MNNLSRIIELKGKKIKVDLNNPVYRWPGNPILTPHDVNKYWTAPHLQVITTHNAGIAKYDNEFIMLFRSHLRNGISVLGIARSRNGTEWQPDKQPAFMPCSKDDTVGEGIDINTIIENESGGVEDPRITKIGDTFYITYSAYHAYEKDRVRVSLASTRDFREYTRYGPLLDVDMRNVVLFPEKINGKYAALMRPNDATAHHTGGIFKQIRIAYANEIVSNNWEVETNPVMRQAGGPGSFADKIGPGAPPIKTRYGWLNIFHGVRSTMDGNPYVLGVAFHEIEDPGKLEVSNIPILFPTASDCIVGDQDYVHVPQVVFTCGAIRNDDGSIYIYYGGNDTVMNLGVTHEDVLAELCRRYPQDEKTGVPLYQMKIDN
ncbi:MAG: glycosidase [Bacteroidetes bacterium]|nr:MAG: glycosidase [Bacteroidota bacterium]